MFNVKLKITAALKSHVSTWIDALRSGEFAQADSALQNASGFCCLGVACKVFIPQHKLLMAEQNDGKIYIKGGEPANQPKSPKWLTFINDDFYHRTGTNLMKLNDTGILMKGGGYEPLTFDEIADALQAVYIEEINFSVAT